MAKEQTPTPANTSYSHQDLISENAIDVATLPEKTQRKLKKFAATTDEDQKDALDIALFGEIDEIVEKKKEEAKAEAIKQKRDAHKTAKEATPPAPPVKKGDVSGAPTAKQPAGNELPAAPPKERSFMRKILGQP